MHCILFYDVNVKRLSRFRRPHGAEAFLDAEQFLRGRSLGIGTGMPQKDINRTLDPEEDSVIMIWTPSQTAWKNDPWLRTRENGPDHRMKQKDYINLVVVYDISGRKVTKAHKRLSENLFTGNRKAFSSAKQEKAVTGK